MQLKRYILLILTALWFTAASCSDPNDVPGPTVRETKQRTFFLYIAADNSLGSALFDYQNIRSLVGAVHPDHLQQANIVIYHDPKSISSGRPDVKPRLLEVVTGSDGKASTREIQAYPEQNSGSAEVFEEILTQVVTKFPAEQYSLLMWSHGSGWLPGDYLNGDYTRAIAQDNRGGTNSWIEIDQFAAAIPDGLFDCILFDACNMAYAEVAYPLRAKTKRIIGSSIEILDRGMNYELMPDLLLPATPDYKAFCDAFYDTYNTDYGCTISLIATEGMEALAASVKDILKNVDMQRDIIAGIPTASLQRYGRNSYAPAFFDLGQFMGLLGSAPQLTAFEQAMGRVVEYTLYSDEFRFSGGFKITSHSGLGCYIPRDYPKLNAYYATTEWCKAVYPN